MRQSLAQRANLIDSNSSFEMGERLSQAATTTLSPNPDPKESSREDESEQIFCDTVKDHIADSCEAKDRQHDATWYEPTCVKPPHEDVIETTATASGSSIDARSLLESRGNDSTLDKVSNRDGQGSSRIRARQSPSIDAFEKQKKHLLNILNEGRKSRAIEPQEKKAVEEAIKEEASSRSGQDRGDGKNSFLIQRFR